MVGGIRDSILVKDNHLLYGFIAIFLTVLIGNLVQGSFKLGFDLQPTPIAATCGTCWAWFWWAGAQCCWVAAPCVS